MLHVCVVVHYKLYIKALKMLTKIKNYAVMLRLLIDVFPTLIANITSRIQHPVNKLDI